METKTVMLLVLATLILFASIAYAIEIGVARFNADASFLEDIRVLGTIRGASNIRVAEGIDYPDVNGLVRYSTYVQLLEQQILRTAPDDLNAIYIFENSTSLTPFNISWIFWNSVSLRPSLYIQDGFRGRANIFDRSLMIGKQKGIADINVNYNKCPLGKMSLADCDTLLTGADLVVEDDIETFGSTQVHENLFVDGNSFVTFIYGSMFERGLGNTIDLTDTTNFFLIDDMNYGLSNGFTFDGNSHLRALESGVYKVDWSLSFDDLASRSFEGGITVDSVIQVPTLAQIRTVNANDQTSFSGTGIINIDANQLVALEIRAITSSSTITVEQAGLTLIRVGN